VRSFTVVEVSARPQGRRDASEGERRQAAWRGNRLTLWALRLSRFGLPREVRIAGRSGSIASASGASVTSAEQQRDNDVGSDASTWHSPKLKG